MSRDVFRARPASDHLTHGGRFSRSVDNDAVNRVRAVLENGYDPAIRSGDSAKNGNRFDWIPFYEAASKRATRFQEREKRRTDLDGIFAVRVPAWILYHFTPLEDRFRDGTERTVERYLPFYRHRYLSTGELRTPTGGS